MLELRGKACDKGITFGENPIKKTKSDVELFYMNSYLKMDKKTPTLIPVIKLNSLLAFLLSITV